MKGCITSQQVDHWIIGSLDKFFTFLVFFLCRLSWFLVKASYFVCAKKQRGIVLYYLQNKGVRPRLFLYLFWYFAEDARFVFDVKNGPPS